jgi:hypothetical protein
MGLLDDAIRDHLELKRRHGADPGEVSKLEHEAFGPIQREDALEVGPPPPGAAHDDLAEHELAEEEEAAYEEAELEADEIWEAEHPADRVAPAAGTAPGAADPVPEDAGAPPAAGSVRADLVADDEPPAAGPPAPAAATPEAGEHDELEETPEFLQETPEHDRLWFEQKPPRDFDF